MPFPCHSSVQNHVQISDCIFAWNWNIIYGHLWAVLFSQREGYMTGFIFIYIFEFDYFISLVRSVECFLFSLLFMWVLLASAASWFECVVVLPCIFL